MLNRLVFDTEDVDASANIGAWLRAGTDGDQIDSKAIGGTEWLQTAAALFDGEGNAITSDAGALFVTDSAQGNTAVAASAEPVTTTESPLVTSVLSGRKYLYAYNNGNKTAFVGQVGVLSTTGFPLFPGALLELRAGSAVNIRVIGEGSTEIRTLQLA